MTNSIWEHIASISWVFYAALIYLIFIGIKATKPNVVSANHFFFMPCLLMMLSLIWIGAYAHPSLFNLLAWSITFSIGSALGWIQFHFFKVKAVKNQYQIRLPGSWLLLINIMITLFFIFYVDINMSPALQSTSISILPYAFYILILYGFVTGLFIGRLIYVRRCLKKGPYYAPISTEVKSTSH